MDGSEEGEDLYLVRYLRHCSHGLERMSKTYHSAVANLDRLNEVHHSLGSLNRDVVGSSESDSVVHLPGEENSLERGHDVRDDTGQAIVQSLLGDTLQAEGILDNFLEQC